MYGFLRSNYRNKESPSDPATHSHPILILAFLQALPLSLMLIHAPAESEREDSSLAPGSEDSLCPLVQRQWSVQIGDILNYCEVELIGYNLDGTPELVAVDADNYGIKKSQSHQKKWN